MISRLSILQLLYPIAATSRPFIPHLPYSTFCSSSITHFLIRPSSMQSQHLQNSSATTHQTPRTILARSKPAIQPPSLSHRSCSSKPFSNVPVLIDHPLGQPSSNQPSPSPFPPNTFIA